VTKKRLISHRAILSEERLREHVEEIFGNNFIHRTSPSHFAKHQGARLDARFGFLNGRQTPK